MVPSLDTGRLLWVRNMHRLCLLGLLCWIIISQVAYTTETFISHSPGFWKPKTRVPALLVSAHSPLLCVQMSTVSLCAHGGSAEGPALEWFSHKGTDPTTRVPPWRHDHPHLYIPSHWGLGLQHKSWGHKHSVHRGPQDRYLASVLI